MEEKYKLQNINKSRKRNLELFELRNKVLHYK